jgi:hypothetical protein
LFKAYALAVFKINRWNDQHTARLMNCGVFE